MKTAVILFNLGGPDSPEAVRPFLFNLFNDPAIIRLSAVPRRLLAAFIAWRRAPVAREIYARMGGRSPIYQNTLAQADALEARLGRDFKCFVAMRYWHPTAIEQARAVRAWAPDRIVLLPLYPQYSTTTTESSFADWDRAAAKVGLAVKTHRVCCWPNQAGYIHNVCSIVTEGLAQLPPEGKRRILFSAHGLPKRIVEAGDPYAWQVEQTVAAVMRQIGEAAAEHVICYQSRVGPLEWLGPSTPDEVKRAGRDKVPVVVVPIAFVSEHSETLVELDIEYAALAKSVGVPAYIRVPVVGVGDAFIDGLAGVVSRTVSAPSGHIRCAGDEPRLCPKSFSRCPSFEEERHGMVG
jgi:ferrochelatase